MSMTLMVAAMKAKVGNPLRKLVLIKLADQANDQGECWPSFAHIAEHCEITRRSVINHINALRDAGFLSVQHRPGEKGNASNVYHLHIASGDETLANSKAQKPLAKADKVVKEIHQGGENGSPGVVKEIHPGGETDSPPLVKEIHPESVSFEPVNEPKTTTPPLRASSIDPGVAEPAEPFAMHMQWQPRVTPSAGGAEGPFADRCAMVGVTLDLIPAPTQKTLLGEFISYWETRPDEYTQAKWEHKFLQRLLDKHNRGELYAEPGQAGGGAATRSRSLVDDLTDRSWAQ